MSEQFLFPHLPKSPFKGADEQLLRAVLMVHQHWHPMTRQSTRVFIASDGLPVGTQDLDRPANLRQMKWRLVSSGCSICESFSSRLLAFVLSTREKLFSLCCVSITLHWDKYTDFPQRTDLQNQIRILFIHLHASVNLRLNV